MGLGVAEAGCGCTPAPAPPSPIPQPREAADGGGQLRGSSVSWLSPTHSLVSAVRLPMEADPWTLLTVLRFTAQA